MTVTVLVAIDTCLYNISVIPFQTMLIALSKHMFLDLVTFLHLFQVESHLKIQYFKRWILPIWAKKRNQ
jgi:hypothetical protein